MAKNISINLGDSRSLDAAIKQLTRLKQDIPKTVDKVCRDTATRGAVKAESSYRRAAYDGNKLISVTVEPIKNGYAVIAGGESVLFVEFGAGVRYADNPAHPNNFGYRPGTYPGKGHWDDPRGWWIPVEHGGGHTYGNPASMTMYETAKSMRKQLHKKLKEAFAK